MFCKLIRNQITDLYQPFLQFHYFWGILAPVINVYDYSLLGWWKSYHCGVCISGIIDKNRRCRTVIFVGMFFVFIACKSGNKNYARNRYSNDANNAQNILRLLFQAISDANCHKSDFIKQVHGLILFIIILLMCKGASLAPFLLFDPFFWILSSGFIRSRNLSSACICIFICSFASYFIINIPIVFLCIFYKRLFGRNSFI